MTDESFGAWLLRCNLKVFDLDSYMSSGATRVAEWTVRRGYRTDRMKAGDRLLLWVAGDSSRLARGVWGVGVVTDDAIDLVPTDLATVDEASDWLDQNVLARVEAEVPTDIELLTQPVTDQFLRAKGVSDWEVQKQPQIANPSFLTKAQTVRFVELWGGTWPESDASKPAREAAVSVSPGGAGFGTPNQNRVVELAAMEAVASWYRDDYDWGVEDVSKDNVGWDLTCTSPDGDIERVEVKGVTGNKPTVLLTANEIRAARVEDGWTLVVVTRAVSDPTLAEYEADAVVAAARAYVFRAQL